MLRIYSTAALLALLLPATLTSQTDTWSPIGPSGDFIVNLEQTSDGTMYAVGNSRVYRLLPGETTWESIRYIDTLPRSTATPRPFVALDDVLIVGSGCCNTALSFDRGTTWVAGPSMENNSSSFIRFSAIDRGDSILFMWPHIGGLLLSSIDSGRSWRTLDTIGGFGKLATDGSKIYATISATPGLVVVETDSVRPIGPEALSSGYELFASGDTMMLTGRLAGQPRNGRFRSYDGGENWDFVDATVLGGEAEREGRLWGLDVDGIYSMPIDGNSWDLSIPIDRPTGSASRIRFRGDTLYVGDALGMHRGLPGDDRLEMVSDGIIAYEIRRLFEMGDSLLAVGPYGLYTMPISDPPTIPSSWTYRPFPDATPFSLVEQTGTRIYAHRRNTFELIFSDDNGQSWDTTEAVPAESGIFSALHAVGDQLHVVSGRSIYRSADAGRRWERVVRGDLPIDIHAFSGSGDTIMGYSTGHPGTGFSTVAMRTVNGGGTWDPVRSPVANPQRPIIVEYHDGRFVMAIGRHGVFASDDGGSSWQRLEARSDGSSGEILDFVWSIISTDRHLFIYGSTVANPLVRSLIVSNDRGQSWHSIPDSPVPVDIELIGDDLYIGTSGSAVMHTILDLSTDGVDHQGWWPIHLDLL